MKKEKISLKEANLKQGDKETIEFAVLGGHTPCRVLGYAKYFCEVLKVTGGYVYFYLSNHLKGEKLGCKLQKVAISPKYETAWAFRTKE